MAAEFSQADADVQALAQNVQAVEARSAALNAALATSRQTSLFILLAAVVFVVVVAGSFYGLGKEVISDKNQQLIVQLAQKQLVTHSDDYMREVKSLIDETSPKLTAAFAERAKQDMPAFVDAIDAQRGPLLQNIETRLADTLVSRQQSVLDSKKQILIDEFPSIQDEKKQDAMIANLRVAVDKLIKKHYLDRLHEELLALAKNLDEFPAAEPSTGNDDAQLEDELTSNLMKLLSLKLTQSTQSAETN